MKSLSFILWELSWSILSRRRSGTGVGRLLRAVAAELRPLLVLHAGEADAVHQVLRRHHSGGGGGVVVVVRSEVSHCWLMAALWFLGDGVMSGRCLVLTALLSIEILQLSTGTLIVWRGYDITGIISDSNHYNVSKASNWKLLFQLSWLERDVSVNNRRGERGID